jgi:DNA invertase Pin-like site-specific DNA recombinase
MKRNPTKAVAYYRTSSATNVGRDKDSLKRQREAVMTYAKHQGIVVVEEFNDPAISGADPIDQRPGFAALLKRIEDNGVGVVLVEDPTRFARDLAIQLAGHGLLKGLGIELVPANCPEHFREDTPTAELVRQVLGAIAQFDKAQTVTKLRGARDRKSKEAGRRIEGRKPVPLHIKLEARRLARRNPKTAKVRSYRQIAAELASKGLIRRDSGKAYGAESIKRMLTPKQQKTRARA